MWACKKSRWSPWTASKTQGSLVIATLLDIQCFRRPARGRWLMTVRIQCKIIPGNRCGGLPFGWLEELAVGPFWHPFLGSWMKDETDWLVPPQWSPHLLKEVMQPRKTWVVWERFTTEAAWSKIFAGLNCGLGPSPEKVFASLRKFLWGKRWQSSLWIGVV